MIGRLFFCITRKVGARRLLQFGNFANGELVKSQSGRSSAVYWH
jgi:hypothetical protein